MTSSFWRNWSSVEATPHWCCEPVDLDHQADLLPRHVEVGAGGADGPDGLPGGFWQSPPPTQCTRSRAPPGSGLRRRCPVPAARDEGPAGASADGLARQPPAARQSLAAAAPASRAAGRPGGRSPPSGQPAPPPRQVWRVESRWAASSPSIPPAPPCAGRAPSTCGTWALCFTERWTRSSRKPVSPAACSAVTPSSAATPGPDLPDRHATDGPLVAEGGGVQGNRLATMQRPPPGDDLARDGVSVPAVLLGAGPGT